MGFPGPKGDKGDIGPSGSPVSDSVNHTTHHITSLTTTMFPGHSPNPKSVIIQREGRLFFPSAHLQLGSMEDKIK